MPFGWTTLTIAHLFLLIDPQKETSISNRKERTGYDKHTHIHLICNANASRVCVTAGELIVTVL